MEKIPCRECGALILPTTAEDTGGVCMACKQGIRKNIEAARAYYDSLKGYDPARELWTSLANRSSDEPGLESWMMQEKMYFAVCLLDKEIYNGGFDQYFFNISSNYYYFAVDGLEEIGALQSLKLVQDAANTLFGKDGPPVDQGDRRQAMDPKIWQLSEILAQNRRKLRLDQLDKYFCMDPDQLESRLMDYAKQHGLVSPFESRPD